MNKGEQEDLEAFLIEAELINQKVKALAQDRLSPQEYEEIQAKREQDLARRQEAKERKERQAKERVRQGREGKGISKDFKYFCRHCHLQFTLETPTCVKCNRPTMPLQQRQKQLEVMVANYKFNKKQREEKKHKWDMFQKTQASLWKKSSIDYNKKWDYFVQDSDEEPEQEPILPTHDPNFRALEADIEERKRKRRADTEKAKSLKDKGNAQMKKGDYQKAMEYYTLALEFIKDIKAVYTNRALAYIRLKKYRKAIKDCTNVIEYMEVFEKQGENKDLVFKAYSRRALARKEIKEYKMALEDIEQALKLYPKDQGALMNQKEIQGFLQHTETLNKIIQENKEAEKEQQPEQQEDSEDEKQRSKKLEKDIVKQIAEEQLRKEQDEQAKKKQQEKEEKRQPQVKKPLDDNPVKQIPKRLQDLNEENVSYLLHKLASKNELKSVFIASKGIEKVLSHMIDHESAGKQVLLVCMCLEGEGVGEKRVWEWGVNKLTQKIEQKFADQTKLNQATYDFIDNLLVVLVPLTLYEPYRLQLSSSEDTVGFIRKMFPRLITKVKKQPQLLDNFLLFVSNLVSKESKIKDQYLSPDQIMALIASLDQYLWRAKTKNRLVLDARQTSMSLVSNLLTSPKLRKVFVEKGTKEGYFETIKDEIETYPRHAHNFLSHIQNVISLLVNASLDTQIPSDPLAPVIMNRFVSEFATCQPTILYRSLLAVSRLHFTSNQHLVEWLPIFDRLAASSDPIKKPEDKDMMQVVKILNVMLALEKPKQISSLPGKLWNSLSQFILENDTHEVLFCNTCNLMGILVQHPQKSLREQALPLVRKAVPLLVDVAKDRVGNWRKNAAILLGKSSGDPQCRAQLDRTHGMEVLKSIASHVMGK